MGPASGFRLLFGSQVALFGRSDGLIRQRIGTLLQEMLKAKKGNAYSNES